MRKIEILLSLISILDLFVSYKQEEDKNFFQLCPSDKPYQLNLFNLESDFYTYIATGQENLNLIKTTKKTDENPIKDLSSIIVYKNQFQVKTCFGPNKIVEIIDENNQVLTPKDDYFKNVANNLENIKYCFSTSVANPYIPSEFNIVIYWTELNKEIYTHKVILFFPSTKSFSQIYTLDTNGDNFYAQDCTTLRNKFIYCNIDSSIELSKSNHFSIIFDYINANEFKILFRLVKVFSRISNTIYHKPIGINKHSYSKTGKYVDYFLTEYHDEKNQKTRLMTSIYVNHDQQSLILRFDDKLEIYHGINIEDKYIQPNLFNHLLPNMNGLIIIYIMKNYEGKNLLLLNEYDYTHDLKFKTELDKYSSSNYEREDICENPKYMQSAFVNSFINYDGSDKQKVGSNTNNEYFVYQRDIATVISCDDENGNVFYQAKKIQMPQCLNTLNEINGKSNALIFTEDNEKIIIDFENPNYKSFRNVEIEFLDSPLYNKVLIVQGVKGGERTQTINKTTTFSDLDRIEVSRTLNCRKGKTYQIPYRIKQTGISGVASKCHLTSEICYLEFKYQVSDTEPETPGGDECPYCEEFENQICFKCQDIIGIKKKSSTCGCECDEDKGFNPKPKIFGNKIMCECKANYSFYEGIEKCKKDDPPDDPGIQDDTSGPISPSVPKPICDGYCIMGKDEISLKYIYFKIEPGLTTYIQDGKCFCKIEEPPVVGIEWHPWFQLGTGPTSFFWQKINKCVYIKYKNNSIVMYSNQEDCKYDDNFRDDYNEFLNINNEITYNSVLYKAYEYKPYGDNNSLIIKKDNITYYILNNYTDKNYSSVKISDGCLKKLNEIKSISSLLIFIASIKREGYSSVQVEYSFYNPNPESINQNIILSEICKNKNSNLRALSTPSESTNNENDVPINCQKLTNFNLKTHFKT